jgi:hypothetical protein
MTTCPVTGSLGFRMECARVHLERPFEQACRLSIQALQCSPRNYSENTKLGGWVHTQRYQYRLQLEGKISQITTFRIQEVEETGFWWKCSISGEEGHQEISTLVLLAACSLEKGSGLTRSYKIISRGL